MDGLDPEHIGVQYHIRHATVEGANSWPLGMQLIHPYITTTVIKDFAWAREEGNWRVEMCPSGRASTYRFAAWAVVCTSFTIEAVPRRSRRLRNRKGIETRQSELTGDQAAQMRRPPFASASASYTCEGMPTSTLEFQDELKPVFGREAVLEYHNYPAAFPSKL